MLRKRLASTDVLLGLLQTNPNPLIAQLAGECGYDFVFLDDEHGVMDESDFAESLSLLAPTNVFAFVRLAGHDREDMQAYLEMGAHAILVPQTSTAEEVSVLARAMSSYPESCLIPIIESVPGAKNSAEILAIEGVAGVIVGPNDLSASVGHPGDFAHPSYEQALTSIERAAADAGKILGTIPHGAYSLDVLRTRGHRLFILGTDSWLIKDAMSAQVAQANAVLGRGQAR